MNGGTPRGNIWREGDGKIKERAQKERNALFFWASCNFSAELGKNINLQPQTQKRLLSAELKTFPMHGLYQQEKKCSRFCSRFCHAPVIPETAGKADVVLTSMQWHVTATLTVLFQPFNSLTGGNSDTDTSANAMCSHKSSIYISFFFSLGKP